MGEEMRGTLIKQIRMKVGGMKIASECKYLRDKKTGSIEHDDEIRRHYKRMKKAITTRRA